MNKYSRIGAYIVLASWGFVFIMALHYLPELIRGLIL